MPYQRSHLPLQFASASILQDPAIVISVLAAGVSQGAQVRDWRWRFAVLPLQLALPARHARPGRVGAAMTGKWPVAGWWRCPWVTSDAKQSEPSSQRQAARAKHSAVLEYAVVLFTPEAAICLCLLQRPILVNAGVRNASSGVQMLPAAVCH